jgi:hypothetical protein
MHGECNIIFVYVRFLYNGNHIREITMIEYSS